MLKTFTAALVATALVAGPAFAAGTTPSDTPAAAPTAPATVSTPDTASQAGKGTMTKKPVKHARVHGRKHVVHHAAKMLKTGKVSKTSNAAKAGKSSKKAPA